MEERELSVPTASAEPPEALDVGFDDPVLMRPTGLERELGHEVDDDEAVFVEAVKAKCGVDAKVADAAYALYCELREQQEQEE